MDIYNRVDLRTQMTEGPRNPIPQDLKSHKDQDATIREARTLRKTQISTGPWSEGTVKTLLESLGVANSLQNQEAALLAMLYGVPLNDGNLSFFINGRYQTPLYYQILMEQGLRDGHTHEVEKLKSSIPRGGDLADFLKDIQGNMERLMDNAMELSQALLRGKNSESLKKFLGDFYSGILIQFNDNLPFHHEQIPLMVKDNIYPWGLWLGKGKEVAYLDFMLPNLKNVGCLLEDWTTSLMVTLYCQKEFEKAITNRASLLKETLRRLGFKCKSLKVQNNSAERGLLDFLLQFQEEHKSIDISI